MPDNTPKPPKGYQILGGVNIQPDAKLSSDIEDRRNWGPGRNAVAQQKDDFLSYWRNFHKTYPDFHTAYNVVKDSIMNKKPVAPQPVSDQTIAATLQEGQPKVSQAVGPKVGDTKRFNNGTIGVWDGHGWRAK